MAFLMQLAGNLFFERPAHSKSIPEMTTQLQQGGETIAGRIANAAKTGRNHSTVTHLIGIERWSQQRLKVVLGEPFIAEEYDGYRPAEDTPWSALKDQFEATRRDSIALAEALQEADPTTRIDHNMFGALSVRGWLRYMDAHANMTSKLLR